VINETFSVIVATIENSRPLTSTTMVAKLENIIREPLIRGRTLNTDKKMLKCDKNLNYIILIEKTAN
jgi:hypothetical protein